MSQVENVAGSNTWVQHFGGAHLTGTIGPIAFGGVTADEKTSKLTELTDKIINKRADLFMGMAVVFLGKTKITVKSYSAK